MCGILVKYDVNAEDVTGRTHLRKVTSICIAYGQRP